jgi:integrase
VRCELRVVALHTRDELVGVVAADEGVASPRGLVGERDSSIAGLTWDDVDLQAGRITIARQMRRDGPLKTPASRRVVDVDVRRVAELRRHRQEALSLGCAAPSDLVFQRPSGGPVPQRHAHRWVQAAAQRAGLPSPRVHDLRHSLGSVLVAAGVPITTVSRHLGHSNPATTMRIYARELDETQRLGLVAAALSRGSGSHEVATG